jgi:hypothetical protein
MRKVLKQLFLISGYVEDFIFDWTLLPLRSKRPISFRTFQIDGIDYDEKTLKQDLEREEELRKKKTTPNIQSPVLQVQNQKPNQNTTPQQQQNPPIVTKRKNNDDYYNIYENIKSEPVIEPTRRGLVPLDDKEHRKAVNTDMPYRLANPSPTFIDNSLNSDKKRQKNCEVF